jgi:dipeptidyl aminopeptidase/acylaminoacyl peptidase
MSPANYVAQWSTPMLLIHGSKDFAIVDAEAIGAFNALQQYVSIFNGAHCQNNSQALVFRRGVPGRLVVFPDENHYVMKPSNT